MKNTLKRIINPLILASSLALYSARAIGEENSQSRDVSQEGIELIKQYEGFRNKAYWDVNAWAIGYGTREGVKQGDKITRQEAEQRLKKYIDSKVEPVITKYVKSPLTQGQYDSLVDFVYQFGEGNFRKSTLLKKLNSRDYNGTAREFPKWTKSNGKSLKGLEYRRAQDVKSFMRK